MLGAGGSAGSLQQWAAATMSPGERHAL